MEVDYAEEEGFGCLGGWGLIWGLGYGMVGIQGNVVVGVILEIDPLAEGAEVVP